MVQSADADWEGRNQRVLDWVPYLTLGISMVLSLAQSDTTWTSRLETTVLAGLAAVWVLLTYTLAPRPHRAHSLRMLVYFAGLLALAAVLMARQPIFFVFTITGFFHASLLRPAPLMVLGVGATSTLIHTIITGFPWPTIELW